MIVLGDQTYQVEQKRLREWLALEEIGITLGEATEHGDREKLAHSLCLYVSVALGLDNIETRKLPWMEVASAFGEIHQVNEVDLSHIAFIRGKVEDKKEPWDYPGRLWWFWSHTFSKGYGWSIEYISDLKVLDAFSLLQEVMLDYEFRKEWEWSLSEYSVKYNKNTHKSEPNPLPRPDWMKTYAGQAMPQPKPTLIPKRMMPVGNIITHENIEP